MVVAFAARFALVQLFAGVGHFVEPQAFDVEVRFAAGFATVLASFFAVDQDVPA